MGVLSDLWNKLLFRGYRAKETLKEYRQRYAAARPSGLNGPVYGWKADFNALLEQANPILRERVRSLIRNYPPFVRAIKTHTAFVIGQGARFQSMVLNDAGKADTERRKKIESAFRRWMDKASVDGQLHFYECQGLAMRQRLETGEFFCAFRTPKGRGRHPLALQFIESDRVSGGLELRPNSKSAVVWQGVEFDPDTTERFGYHVLRHSWPQRYEYEWDFLPIDRVIHGYDLLRPDQLRGVSVFAAAIILADSMYDYVEAQLDAAKMAAKWLGFVTSPTLEDFYATRNKNDKAPNYPKLQDRVENAAMEYLNPGESVTFAASPNRINDNFDRFVAFVLRMVGSVIGVPYEVLSGDYAGVNYSTARMSRQDYNMILQPERFWMEQNFNRKVFREWLRVTALMEPDLLPGYELDPEHYEKAIWVPAGMPSPDPLKEGKADIDNINNGLDSPQAVIMARGGDPEQVLEDLKGWKGMLEEKGVELNAAATSTAYQTNPAALEGGDE
jgi:lambda family phage portal protein